MSTRILNRDFTHPDDGWYHIEPRGEHPNADAKVVQVIDDEAVLGIVNRFNQDADAGTLSHGADMLIDHEHFSHDTDKETRAFGWLNRLAARTDGIYGRIRWSATGKAAVDGGDYRFFSTEYDPEQCAILNRAKTRLRPLALGGLTLTNRPNNRGGRPITNRTPAAPEQTNATTTNTMKQIATKLGLAAEASEDAIVAEVTKLLNRASDAEGKLTPLITERDLLKNRVTQIDGEQIAADLDLFGVKEDGKRTRLTAVLAPMKNREERTAFLTDCLGKPDEKKPEGKTPLTIQNRAKSPGAVTSAGDEEPAALAQKAASEINTYRIANRCSYGAARNAVRTAKPELFGIATGK